MKERRRRTRTHAWLLLAVFGTSGFLLFCLVPALLFRLVEQWSFGDSLYFTIVTLTTIGFGDFVPGRYGGAVRENWAVVSNSRFCDFPVAALQRSFQSF